MRMPCSITAAIAKLRRWAPPTRGLFFTFLFLLFLPSTASADAGTPLMWTTILHLLIGNVLIGIAEGLLLIALFHTRKLKTILIMILANYLSMLGGMALIPLFYDFLEHGKDRMVLDQFYGLLWKMGLLTFLATLLIEWPCCLWIFWKQQRRIKGSLVANLVAQAASYALLVPIYMYSSIGLDLARNFQHDQNIVNLIHQHGTIYYLSPDNKELRSIGLDGKSDKKIMDLMPLTRETYHDEKLYFGYRGKHLAMHPADSHIGWNLWLDADDYGTDLDMLNEDGYGKTTWVKHSEGKNILLLKDIKGKVGLIKSKSSFSFFNPADFRTEKERAWHISVDTYAGMSNVIIGRKNERSYYFFVETPFLRWDGRFPTVLPDDKVILEFGEQILLLDLTQKQIGLIAPGKQPVVVLE